jgi:EmrB/QacA subfamily drug resistance transporter
LVENKEESFYIWTTLAVVVIGTFMAILDSSIVNIAIPKMMAIFQVSVEHARWIITCYTLTIGAVIPITGYLTDRFGSKKIYILALGVFTIGSLLCSLSWNIYSMIFFRILQGLGGGMLMPVSMAILFQVVPVEKRGFALGLWGIAAMAAPTIGPTLSGYIIDYLDWRIIFTINLPIGFVGIILSGILLRESPLKKDKQFDLVGFITSTVAMVFLLYLLGEGSSLDWKDITNVLLLVIGLFSLVIFVVNELLHPAPLLDLRLLKIFPFTLSIIITSVLNMSMFGVIFLIPLYLQNLAGYSPMQSGMIMLPSALAAGVFMALGGRLFDKFGAKPLLVPGTLLLIFATYSLAHISLDMPLRIVIYLLILRSMALGFTAMPASTAGMNCVPQPMIARATALSNTFRQISVSMSVTILTTIMLHVQNMKYAAYASDITPFNQTATNIVNAVQRMLMQTGAGQREALSATQGAVYGVIARQAFLDSINVALMVSTIFAVIALPLSFLMRGKEACPPEVRKAVRRGQEIDGSITVD